jgi:hypothetical protein
MTIRLPLVSNLHGAELVDSDGSGFVVKAAGGATLGVLPYPPSPDLLKFENPTSAPKSTWAAQKMIETYVEFEFEQSRIAKDDSISETERIRRMSKLSGKIIDAIEHIERDFAAEEADAKATEEAFYSLPQLKADDVIGALRDQEIRNGLQAMESGEKSAILRALNNGEERPILEAALRSPLKMGLIDQFAKNGWRALRDREDPQRVAGFALRKSYNDWGRRVVGAVTGTLSAKLRRA